MEELFESQVSRNENKALFVQYLSVKILIMR